MCTQKMGAQPPARQGALPSSCPTGLGSQAHMKTRGGGAGGKEAWLGLAEQWREAMAHEVCGWWGQPWVPGCRETERMPQEAGSGKGNPGCSGDSAGDG